MAKKKAKAAPSTPKRQDVPPGFTPRHTLRGHKLYVNRIAWSPDGRFLATPSDDKTIRIWDADSGVVLKDLKEHTASVNAVAWSPDGRTLASGAADRTVRLWDADGTPRHVLTGHTASVNAVAWTPGGRTLASGAGDTVRLWGADGAPLRALEGHTDTVFAVAWSPDGRTLASVSEDNTLRLWGADGAPLRALEGHTDTVFAVAWSPDGRTLASGAGDHTVRLWGADGTPLHALEGHAGDVFAVAWSPDGRLLASKSQDSTVRLWRVETWEQVALLEEDIIGGAWGLIAFNPTRPAIATLGNNNRIVRIWELDFDVILGNAPVTKNKLYTSAKVVLVGDSNVGKSWLATRLVERRCPTADEIGTTHGMKIWKQTAREFHPNAAAADPDEEREVFFWDLGGQEVYQLVHQMFLHDTTLALVLIDPTRDKPEWDKAREWNLRLTKQLAGRKAVKLLVGTQVDDDTRAALIDRAEVRRVCEQCGFAAFYEASAKTDREVDRLRRVIADNIDWALGLTCRPELFQRIREEVDERQKKGEVVVLLADLNAAVRDKYPDLYEAGAAAGVTDQLALQGLVAKTQLKDGDQAVILRVDVAERYAGSLVVAARENPRGVPALQEAALGGVGQPLPGMTEKDRLPKLQERIVLECVAELMIRHGVCFRHEGLLIFPTLFKDPPTAAEAEALPHSVSLWYDFTGAIDNIYASLVAGLMVLRPFGAGRLAAGKAEFGDPAAGVCGLRQIKRPGGLAHIDLFFGPNTPQPRKDAFTAYVEDHLRRHGVEITERKAIKCECGKEIDEPTVRERIADGKADVLCPRCERRTAISKGMAGVRERDPEADRKVFALRQEVEKKLAEDARRPRKSSPKPPPRRPRRAPPARPRSASCT